MTPRMQKTGRLTSDCHKTSIIEADLKFRKVLFMRSLLALLSLAFTAAACAPEVDLSQIDAQSGARKPSPAMAVLARAP